MIPRLDISFPLKRQFQFWFGKTYKPKPNEFLLNSARSGIVLALRLLLPDGGTVGMMAYNCDTVMNAIHQAGCKPLFLDVNDDFTCNATTDQLLSLDAIIVTNLFGIHNDIQQIRNVNPNLPIIVDNAHGYKLQADGDFTVYSINQGKYPALGPGGLLLVNNPDHLEDISHKFNALPINNSLFGQCKLFVSMLIKAVLYYPFIFTLLTYPIKRHKRPKSGKPEAIVIARMSIGINRMYNAWLNSKHINTDHNMLFMDIIKTTNQDESIASYSEQGIEADVHFRNWPLWAANYGYKSGDCPTAERLLHEVIMTPNYFKQ